MIEDVLKKQFPNLPDLRVREIVVDRSARKVLCTLSYPDLASLDRATRDQVVRAVKGCVPDGFYCNVSLAADVFDEISFQKYVFSALKTQFLALSDLDQNSVIVKRVDGRKFHVTMFLSDLQRQIADDYDFVRKFSGDLSVYSCYSADFTVLTRQNDASFNDIKDAQRKLEDRAIRKELAKPQRKFAVSDVVKYIGKKVVATPGYIVDLKEPTPLVTLCGKISEKSTVTAKNNPNLGICKFKLTDASGSIGAVMFVRYRIDDVDSIREMTGKTKEESLTVSRVNRLHNEKLRKQLLELYDGTEVVLTGKAVVSSYSSALEVQVYDLSKCRIQDGAVQTVSREIPKDYSVVFPKEFTYTVQETFDFDNKIESNEKSDDLPQNTVLAFADFTGNNPLTDKIVSLSFAKIGGDGTLKQLFHTLVNPELKKIPTSILKALAISESDLLYEPTISEIVPDVVKFLDGATLACFEPEKLSAFLNYYSSPIGYEIKNDVLHLNEFFSASFDKLGVSSKPDCSSLADVAKKLHVAFDASKTVQSQYAATLAADCVKKCLQKSI